MGWKGLRLVGPEGVGTVGTVSVGIVSTGSVGTVPPIGWQGYGQGQLLDPSIIAGLAATPATVSTWYGQKQGQYGKHCTF